MLEEGRVMDHDPGRHEGPHSDGRDRRGAFLLMVMSVLTLFVLVGTIAILEATRARETSAAFAAATAGADNRPVMARTLTNEALMLLVRGSTDDAIHAMLGSDSLLEDMYGTESHGLFVDEAYDAYDHANPFLTQMAVDDDGRATHASRPAFAVGDRAGELAVVDNDNDGIPDGIWLPRRDDEGKAEAEFFPSMQLKDRTYQFRVSYLVLELDGRVNINAHGRPLGDTRSSSELAGPADIDGRSITGDAAWSLFLAQSNEGPLPYYEPGEVRPDDQWRQPLNLRYQPVDGRFGGSSITRTYDLRLDLDAPRPSLLAGSLVQNPLTLGELERVLRQFDPDASTLPPRIDGILGDRTERARMRITTDSWETMRDRADLNWVAPNSGVEYEREFYERLFQYASKVVPPADHARLRQWLANVVDFRDMDNANTNFGSGIRGAEPIKDGLGQIPGTWNQGMFPSYAQLVGVPSGTPQQIEDAANSNTPLASFVIEYPRVLETFMTQSFFKPTIEADKAREPGKVNINTCDAAVWQVLLGEGTAVDDERFPYPDPPIKNLGEMMLDVPLIFSGDGTYDVRSVNHDVANRLANVATVRSHVFAVWITLEVTDTSPQADPPSYHRLFAIVDRSIPLVDLSIPPADRTIPPDFSRGSFNHVRNTIRLVRFLN
jgi:hypothetical protein